MAGESRRDRYSVPDAPHATQGLLTGVVVNDSIVLIDFINRRIKNLDRDNDGNLSKAEVIGKAERMFTKIDANDDGKITSIELEASRRR
jgi:hypothetical protein